MSNHLRNIAIAFLIGCAVFVVGNVVFGDFNFKNVNAFLTTFAFYQLYSFVLGFSNKYFFDYLETLPWKKGDTVKRIVVGILGSTTVTLLMLFVLRALISMLYFGRTFNEFLDSESIKSYQFGLWITLTIVIIFHFVYFYNKYQKNKLKEQKVIAGTASAKFDALKNQLEPHFLKTDERRVGKAIRLRFRF